MVSGVSSVSALSAGDDSAPDVSENMSTSKALRGVVKEGFRNGVAVVVVEAKVVGLVSVRGTGGLEGDSNVPGTH